MNLLSKQPFLRYFVRAFWVGTCLSSTAPGQESTVIVVSGDSPAGVAGNFLEIDSSFLADSGAVYFSGNLRENGQFRNSGLFTGTGARGDIRALVLSGDPAPDSNGNVSGVPDLGYQANASGQVAAILPLTGTTAGNSDNAGLFFVGGPNRGLTQIARKGERIPDGNGGTFTRVPLGLSLNNAGQLAFSASIVNSAASFFGNAVYLFEDNVATEIFRSGTRNPENNGDLQNFGIGTVPTLNEQGEIALKLTVSPDQPNGPRIGIFLADKSGISTVAYENQTVSGGNGTLNGLSLTTPSLGNSSHVAFWSQLRNTAAGSADAAAVFRTDGSGLVEIARRNDLCPDGNGRYLNIFGIVDVNRAGDVVFQSTISGANLGSDEGIFIGNGTTSRVIARVGDPTPGGGTLGDFVEESLRVNDRGQVLFTAVLKFSNPGGPVGNRGLFLHDPTLGLLEITREGENFQNLGTLTEILPNLRSQSNNLSRGSLNAGGQVAYRAFIGGNAVIIRWSPPAGAGPIIVPAPKIAITGDELTLKWPQTTFGLEIESTTDPSDGTSWKVRSGTRPVLTGGEYTVTLPATLPREFFRLRRSN